jgi:hemolysin activation/secretion protein
LSHVGKPQAVVIGLPIHGSRYAFCLPALRSAVSGLLAAAALLSAGPCINEAAAQVPVSPPARSDLIPPEQRTERRAPTLTIDGDLVRPPCALDQPQFDDLRFTLKGARFAGLERVSGLSLDESWTSYRDREVPVSALCDIRARANAILRREGYLATVEIPEQSLAEGIPQFRVVFGRLTAIRVRGDAGASERLVERYLTKLTGQDVFNTREAERYLLLADDLPGLNVRLSLRPAVGGEPGDLLGEIAVVSERGAIDLNVQNYGSDAIGRFGGLLRGELYNLTGLGDRTTVAVFSTLEFAEQQTLQIGHDFRLGSEGLRIGTQFTYSVTNPDINLPGFDIESETVFASLFASYPLVRSRSSSLYIDAGFDLANQIVELNRIALTRDRVRMLFARLSGDVTDNGSIQRLDGYSQFEPSFRLRYMLEARQGLDVFSLSPDCRINPLACLIGGRVPPSRIEANPAPFVVRFDTGVEYRPVPLLAFSLRVSGQLTGDALPAFEEYAGGNFSIGRGYDPGTVLGDKGVGASFETRFGSLAPKGTTAIAWQPYVFSDFVRVWNEDPSRSGLNPDRLWSAGGGVRAAWGSKMRADVLLAVPLERPVNAPQLGDIRLMVSLIARLFPWRF